MIDGNAATCNNVMEKFDEKITRIEEKINELVGIRNQLLDGQKLCQKTCCHAPIKEVTCAIIISIN